MNIMAILEAVVAGLTTAIAWAVALWTFNFFRNRRLKSKLQRVFAIHSVSVGIEGFGFGLYNHTDIPVTVRDVRFYKEYPKYSYVMNYVGPTHEVIDIMRPKEAKTFEKDNSRETEFRYNRPKACETDERGFVVLPPQTGGDWRIPKDAIRPDMRIDAVRIVIEYNTLLGSREIVPIMASTKTIKFLSESFEKVKHKKD